MAIQSSKSEKTSRRRLSSHLQAWFMTNGFFWMRQRMVPFSAGTTVYGKTFEGENFRGCAQNTIHWKTFTVHQALTIMYCTWQMIQGENFHDWLKNRENRESFPPQKFCRIR